MNDLPSTLADLRCPVCDAVQPLYIGPPGGIALQRGPDDVVDCPDCGTPLRLTADARDPNGAVAGLVMTIALTTAILGTVVVAASYDLGEMAVAGLVILLLVLGVGAGMLWNARAARTGRHLVVVAPSKAKTEEGDAP
ncbi:MAG: hypothetical protein AAF744_02865 [Pseudomonadota bacterium]